MGEDVCAHIGTEGLALSRHVKNCYKPIKKRHHTVKSPRDLKGASNRRHLMANGHTQRCSASLVCRKNTSIHTGQHCTPTMQLKKEERDTRAARTWSGNMLEKTSHTHQGTRVRKSPAFHGANMPIVVTSSPDVMSVNGDGKRWYR